MSLAPSIRVPALMTVSVLVACEEDVWPTSWRLVNANRKQINQLLRTAHLLNAKRYYAATQFATQCFVRDQRWPPLALGFGSEKVAVDSSIAGGIGHPRFHLF